MKNKFFPEYEKIKVWKFEGFRLSLYDTFKTDRLGKVKLAYRFLDNGKLIFSGEDFACSPMRAPDSVATAYALLGFLSLQPGDTDSGYFEAYSPEQLEWCKSARAEYLGLLVYNYENRKAK